MKKVYRCFFADVDSEDEAVGDVTVGSAEDPERGIDAVGAVDADAQLGPVGSDLVDGTQGVGFEATSIDL